MNIQPRKVQRVVSILRDPEPKFVSLVDHGANQTPFTALKRLHPTPLIGLTAKKGTLSTGATMTKFLQLQKAAKTAGVRKLVFAQATFASEGDVKKFLEKKGFDNYGDIVSDDAQKTFVVESTNIGDDDIVKNSLQRVSYEKGVIAYVGEIKATSDALTKGAGTGSGFRILPKPGTTAKAADVDLKNKERKKKFDFWSAYYSGSDTLGGVMEDALKDGLPPGFNEVMFAAERAFANTFKAADAADATKLKDQVGKIGNDLATALFGMHVVFQDIVADMDASTDAQKSWANTFKGARDEATDEAKKGTRVYVKVEEDKVKEDKAKEEAGAGGVLMKTIEALTGVVAKLAEGQAATDKTIKKLAGQSVPKQSAQTDAVENEDETPEERREREATSKFAANGVRGLFGSMPTH